MPSNPKATAPSIKKCSSLNSFTSVQLETSRNDPSLDDTHILAHEISFTALPPPQPFAKSSLPVRFSVTVDAQAPYRILSASASFFKVVDLSMTEIQDRSIRILFGPETDLSAFSCAMKSINMERRATIPEIKIYMRNGACHIFEVQCVLQQKCIEEACSIMMLFKSTRCKPQAQHQFITRSSRRSSLNTSRDEARSRYNFITGLGLHTSAQSVNARHVWPAGC